jgi:predicted alpha/beta-hydrolase family hydrolase
LLTSTADRVSIDVGDAGHVSGLLCAPQRARAACVLAHGAGAGMSHPFMESLAAGLEERGIASLRFQFPSMEAGTRRPDPPRRAHAAVRAAVEEAGRALPGLPLFAGGKSFGGRMTSQAQAESPLRGVRGLVFVGFPLHPAGNPSDRRARHLFEVRVPMLFLQGSRDALASLELLRPVIQRLGARATLHEIAHADHSFRVPARTGRSAADVQQELLDALAAWIDALV